MSREEIGENGHLNDVAPGGIRDRHIQNIIDHANSLFPDPASQYPSLPALKGLERGHSSRSTVDDDRDGDANLDDFDLNLLGRSRPSAPFLGLNGPSQRLPLAPSSSVTKPSRVLGDASHHFRPFVTREPGYQSPFQSHPVVPRQSRPDQVLHQHYYDSGGFNKAPTFETPSVPRRTLPPYQASNSTPPLESSAPSSSPSIPIHSSPSTRLSLQKQKNPVNGPPAAPKWTQRLQLDLEHAPGEPPIVNNTRLINPREALPDRFRAVFPYELFNAVQSKCFPAVYGANDNVVVSAPTGSGKTAVLEMAICKLAATPGGENFKIVYQAPTKSLCAERAHDWEKKFSHMNLRCVELTGDTSRAEASRVGSASIIVTTPEKWDSITRKWSDYRKLLQMVRLVLIDEVHILKDLRGATLEAVVSRMKTSGANVRFVALSATIPNIKDIAKWLGRDHHTPTEPAHFEAFGEELRPVKLQRYVYGYEGGSNDFTFEKMLDGKLNLLLAKHSEKKPIMVFCLTRKSCERTARVLAEWWSASRGDDKAWPAPTNRIPVLSRSLQELVRYGVAFHHAGLDVQDRTAIQRNFLDGQLHVICCTSTLAVGVNLPCHTVVLKGTTAYTDNGVQEYSDLEVMQMFGRAGRPQFDNSAVAIIMTKTSHVGRYERMISGTEILESTLHRNLVEHLNSEVGLGTIQDIETAKQWIGGTFLSVRVRQRPQHYNLDEGGGANNPDERMERWCERDIQLLQEYGLITRTTPFRCTEYGHAMSRYMVQFETMKLLLSIHRGATIAEMLQTVCKAEEFKEFRFKTDERSVYRELNKSPYILFPIRETLTQPWHKISMIIQIYLGGVEVPSGKDTHFSKMDLAKEKTIVFDRLNRLVRCIVDCKAYDGDGFGVQAALELARSIAAHAWENKPSQLSQIPGFGPVTVRKWTSRGIRTVLGVAELSTIDIERIAVRNPPYGNTVLKHIEDFPRLTLRADIVQSKAQNVDTDDAVSVTLRVKLGHCNNSNPPTWRNKVPSVTLMAITTDGRLEYFWRGSIRKVDKSAGLDLRFPVALTGPKQGIRCYFSCEEIVGTQVMRTLEPNIPASAFHNLKKRDEERQASDVELLEQDMEFDDVADEDMLDALEGPDGHNEDDFAGPLNDLDGDFPLIEELLTMGEGLKSSDEPAMMANGKWMCKHICRNNGLTKTGKPCTHRCCHEGVDKIRQSSQRKKQQFAIEDPHGADDDPDETFGSFSMPSGSQGTNRLRDQFASGNRTPALPGDRSPGPKTKRHRDNSGFPGPRKSRKVEYPSTSVFGIECIDLAAEDEENADRPAQPKKATAQAGRGRQSLVQLHDSSTTNIAAQSRLTKSYKEKRLSPTPPSIYNARAVNGDSQTSHSENSNAAPLTDFADQGSEEFPDLPDLDELISTGRPHRTRHSSLERLEDETLYPGVVQELKDSIEFG
ncbi:hypothetical protein F4780DRAFT_797401 [Xylariomycetidae sp. FL0641]|nr:hypothetical protein F4780DRAFT_797401 [Xylariomycetidae sp. FL0641]